MSQGHSPRTIGAQQSQLAEASGGGDLQIALLRGLSETSIKNKIKIRNWGDVSVTP